MRVIRPSEVQVECPSCNAMLGVTTSDINVNDTGHGPYCSCVCSQCGQRITLDHNKIPSHMKKDWPD